jgi:hypothetical protein
MINAFDKVLTYARNTPVFMTVYRKTILQKISPNSQSTFFAKA